MKKLGLSLLFLLMCVPASEVNWSKETHVFCRLILVSVIKASCILYYQGVIREKGTYTSNLLCGNTFRHSHWSLRGPLRIPLTLSRTLPETQLPSQMSSLPINILKTCLSFMSYNSYDTWIQYLRSTLNITPNLGLIKKLNGMQYNFLIILANRKHLSSILKSLVRLGKRLPRRSVFEAIEMK